MSKKLKILFTVSVLLNLLLAGIVGGMVIKKRSSHPWHSVQKEFSPEAQNLVAREMQKARKDIKPNIDKIKKSRQKLQKILVAEEFDAGAFEKEMERMHSARQKMMKSKIKTMSELAAQLPPEEREKLMGQFIRRGKRGSKRDHPPLPPRPPDN